ncbi:uncharacterized protein [Primulina huaijiensis]|uniref:uncharacterized protein n=1 Tax=Primulina huaijiensis TaxID=1492673 RepID=UPI003CC78BE0
MPPTRVIDRKGREALDEQRVSPPRRPPDLLAQMLEGMTQFFVHFARNNAEVDRRTKNKAVYERFRKMDPKDFGGQTDPMDAARVRCVTYLLKDDARLWSEGASVLVNLQTLTWEGFKEAFYSKHFTDEARSRLTREFITLRQGDRSVVEIVRKFKQGCHFMSLIANDAREKLRHIMDGLRLFLRRDVHIVGPLTYVVAVTRALAAEQDQKEIEFTGRARGLYRSLSDCFSSQLRDCFKSLTRAKDNHHHRRRMLRSMLNIRCAQSAAACMKESVYGVQASALSVDLLIICLRIVHSRSSQGGKPKHYILDREDLYGGSSHECSIIFRGTHSFISDGFVTYLGVKPTRLDVSYSVIITSGEKLSSSSVVISLSLELQGHTVYADLIVLPMPEFDIILGMDWLSKN